MYYCVYKGEVTQIFSICTFTYPPTLYLNVYLWFYCSESIEYYYGVYSRNVILIISSWTFIQTFYSSLYLSPLISICILIYLSIYLHEAAATVLWSQSKLE